MKIAFIGCVEFSAVLFEVLIAHPEAELVGLVTRSDARLNADFSDLRPLAQRAHCPVCTDTDTSAMARWLRERRPDIIYCFGWSQLLPPDILAIPPRGVVGYHPAALPQNRGRHPIIWALALGLEHTASTFFRMDEGADTGDILSQQTVAIDPQDDAGSLYRKLMAAACEQLRTLTTTLARGNARATPQDHHAANVWRKRSVADGHIDWRMSAQAIHNLVRALAPPYPGAHCDYAGQTVIIRRTRPVAHAQPNLEPGKVLAVHGDRLTIKCGDAAIELLEHEFPTLPTEGSYL
ncbi:MAG TPA: formyl transferase [Gammaproteobacteria bacterium]|nr:formyl transferase [Gammaproteobacteria bacterium]